MNEAYWRTRLVALMGFAEGNDSIQSLIEGLDVARVKALIQGADIFFMDYHGICAYMPVAPGDPKIPVHANRVSRRVIEAWFSPFFRTLCNMRAVDINSFAAFLRQNEADFFSVKETQVRKMIAPFKPAELHDVNPRVQ